MENMTLHMQLYQRPLDIAKTYSTAHAIMLFRGNRKTPSLANFFTVVIPVGSISDFYAALNEQDVLSSAVGLLIPWHNPNLVRRVISDSPCDVSVTAEDTRLLDEIFGQGNYSRMRATFGRPILIECKKGGDGAGLEIAPERRKDCAPQIEHIVRLQPQQMPVSWERVYVGGNTFVFEPKK